METTFKSLVKTVVTLISTLVIMAGIALSAQAQQYGGVYFTSGGSNLFNGAYTNGIVTATRTNYTAVLNTTHYDNFALLISQQGLGASTDNVIYTFAWCLDGTTTTAETNATFRITNALAGTDLTTLITNITANSIGYLQLREITNAAGVNISNVTIKAYFKPRREG